MIRKITVAEFLDGSTELLRQHWLETEADLAPNGPNPSVGMYTLLQEQNSLILFGAFNGDEMVGYVAVFVYPHPHYGIVFAQHDVLFVRKDKRLGSIAGRLKCLADAEARRRGAKFICWHAKPGSQMEKMLSSRYPLEDLIFRQEL